MTQSKSEEPSPAPYTFPEIVAIANKAKIDPLVLSAKIDALEQAKSRDDIPGMTGQEINRRQEELKSLGIDSARILANK